MSLTPETAKRLHDVLRARREILKFSAGKTRDDMYSDREFQLVIERLLEIVGEALRQAERSDPSIVKRIPDTRDYRWDKNRLIHANDDVNYGGCCGTSSRFVSRHWKQKLMRCWLTHL